MPNSSACHAYVMWVELGNYHVLYMPVVLNVVSTGNGTGTENVLKRNHALGFEFASVYGATTVAKVCLFSTWTRWCKLSSFSDHLYCEINQLQLDSTDATNFSKFSTTEFLKSISFHIEESIIATKHQSILLNPSL